MLNEQDIKKSSITVNDRLYPLLEIGEGELVLCLHGFPDNFEAFKKQMGPLSQAGYRVVSPMMPGYDPGNQNPSGRHDLMFVSDEIIALIEALLSTSTHKKCHLIGHDWGAVTSYIVAARRPDLLRSLTTLSIPYNISLFRLFFRCPRYVFNSWYISFFQLKGLADWVVRLNNLGFVGMLYRSWSPTWTESDMHLASVKKTLSLPGVLSAALSYYRNSLFGLNGVSFKFRKWFRANIEVPTLAIRGEIDGCMPEFVWEMMSPKSFRKGLTLEVVPDAGHFLQMEQAEKVNVLLLKWLKSAPESI